MGGPKDNLHPHGRNWKVLTLFCLCMRAKLSVKSLGYSSPEEKTTGFQEQNNQQWLVLVFLKKEGTTSQEKGFDHHGTIVTLVF